MERLSLWRWPFFLAVLALLFLSGSPTSVGVASATSVITQIGDDIDGLATNSSFGAEIALDGDGTTLIVGAPYPQPLTNIAGFAAVYDLTDGQWVQRGGNLTASSAGDQFGGAVAISSDGLRVAVGAPESENSSGDRTGIVRVYEWVNSAWQLVGTAREGNASNDRFGGSVALSDDGSTLAVGAPGGKRPSDGALGVGYVTIFHLTNGSWVQDAIIYGEAANDFSGGSVSLNADGTRVAIGATGNDGAGSFAGHVRVYADQGAWVQLGSDIDGLAESDDFGTSVALSADGSRLVAGATGSGNDNNNPDGQVRVLEWNGTTWAQLGSAINGENPGDYFGITVSISADGSTVAAAADLNDGNGTTSGHARVFILTSGDWRQVGDDIDGASAGDGLQTVSLNAAGTVIATGSPFRNTYRGQVRVFAIADPGVPSANTPSESSARADSGEPGIFLTLSGDTGESLARSTVIFGGFSIAPSSAYLLAVRAEPGTESTQRVLSTGRTTSAGHLERSISLPALGPGTHTISLSAQGRNGELLVLGNRITVSSRGILQSVTPEQLQPTIR